MMRKEESGAQTLDAKEAFQDLTRFSRSTRFFHEHYGKLRVRYPDCWIAILDGKVITASKDQKRLQSRLTKMGLINEPVFVTFVHRLEPTLVLLLQVA